MQNRAASKVERGEGAKRDAGPLGLYSLASSSEPRTLRAGVEIRAVVLVENGLVRQQLLSQGRRRGDKRGQQVEAITLKQALGVCDRRVRIGIVLGAGGQVQKCAHQLPAENDDRVTSVVIQDGQQVRSRISDATDSEAR